MDNIYRGEAVSKDEFISRISELEESIRADLLLSCPMTQMVIEAAHKLAGEVNQQEAAEQLIAMGIPRWAAEEHVRVTINSLSREALERKVHAELGDAPFIWRQINEDIEEKWQPLGAIMHVGAGNTLGLSAFSVIEGLLTGNINILKLPENEGGLSAKLLMRLIEIEPRLKPFIYVLDVSSKEKEIIEHLIKVANAVVVWGSDEAISAIRQLAPPSLPIIEWGHRLSFSYFTEKGSKEEDLIGLAKDICLTDQLYCSSPQCVFYETNSMVEFERFADSLAHSIEIVAKQFPATPRTLNIQAQITWTHQLIKMEEILKEKRLITDDKKTYSVMVDYNAELRASTLYRNIWAMPVKRENLLALLRAHKGYLQTVGLSCSGIEFEELSDIFYAAGVNRITACGNMSANYYGEPHDGIYAMSRYIRKVNRRHR